jgi:OOP family OmpA-OmpF porin
MPKLSLVAKDASISDVSSDQTRARLAALLLEVARSVDQDVAAALPSRLEGDPRLEALRGVVLEQDRAAFTRLQRKIDDPQQFADAVSEVLPTAFSLATSRDDRLGSALAPTLERATRASIRKDPATLAGILYPLVGPAIRRSLAENLDGTLRGLNQALKHGLSWRGLKWRWEAFRSGTTFGDVVLKYTVEFRVEHVFLIHRKTGLLLEHVSAADASTQDPQMISGMLTAIQDFVRDSFSRAKDDTVHSIDSVRLDDLLLWCEEGPFALVAAVIRGNPPETLRASLRETLMNLHRDMGGPLDEFDGDSAPLGNLTTRLEQCLQQREQPRDERLSPWLWAIPIVLLLVFGSWALWRAVEGRRVDAYVDNLRHQPGVVVTSVERRDGAWNVSGLRDPLAVDPASLVAQFGLDPNRLVSHWEPYVALSPAIVLKRFAASVPPPPGVALAMDGGTIRVKGSAPQYWVDKARAMIAALPAGSPRIDLSAVTDVQDPTYVRLRDAIQAHNIHFDSNAPRPAPGQGDALDAVASELRELIRVAKGLGFSVRVMIVGHADSAGAETSNLALSAARAEVVRSMLRDRGIAPDLLLVRSAGTLEPAQSGITGPDDDATNRRVTFTVSTAE